MKKIDIKQILKIKKRMHIMSFKVISLSEDRKTVSLEINGVAITFSNLDQADFITYWKDSPSASAKLIGEIKRAYDEAE